MSIRTDAYNIFVNESDKAKLANVIAGVIENYEKRTISSLLKSQTGTPTGAGSMSFKRFVNSASQAYGTARTAGKGNNLVVPEVVVNLDQKKEIIEEVNKFDLETFGIGGIADRRKGNYQASLRREMERSFFGKALEEGVQIPTIDESAIEASLETKIQALETLQNDFVDGVERDQMALVLRPNKFGALKLKLNDIRNTDFVRVEGEEIKAFNGVATFSSTYLPNGVDGILMVRGAIAQPLVVDEYDLEKINLSNDWALQLYYDFGIKALAPDLVFVAIAGASTTSPISALSVVATVDGDDITGVNGYNISVPASTTTTAIEFQLNRAVALVGTPTAKLLHEGSLVDYGTIALKEGDATKIVITPSGSNGEAGEEAVVRSFVLPANSLTTVGTDEANPAIGFNLTITA